MNAVSGKRVLVTGASGYLGRSVIARFIEAGAHVVGVSRSAPGGMISPWQRLDLLDREAVRRCFAVHRPDVVVHLAGVTGTARTIEHVWPTFTGNAGATVALLEASAQFGCERFVYCASMEEPKAGSIAAPVSPYGASKWVGSIYTRMFHAVFALPTTILRPFFVFGPGKQSATKLVPGVMRAYLHGQRPKVSSPRRNMDWVYIDDVTWAFQLAIANESAVGGEWEIGTGVLHSVGDFVERARIELGIGPELGMTFQSDAGRAEETSPIARVDARLGWEPSVSFEEGVRRTVEWYRSESDLTGS